MIIKRLLIIFIYNLPLFLYANSYSYLLDNPYKTIQNSTFGGIKVQISNVNDKPQELVGVQGGWTTNDTFFMGGCIMSSTNINTPNLTYAGVLIGYNLYSTNVYHPSISLIYGKGTVTKSVRKTLIITSRNNSNDEVITAHDETMMGKTQHFEAFFSNIAPLTFIELQTNLQFNINKWLRTYVSIGYRHIMFNDPTQISYNASSFSGLTYNIGMDIGWWVNTN